MNLYSKRHFCGQQNVHSLHPVETEVEVVSTRGAFPGSAEAEIIHLKPSDYYIHTDADGYSYDENASHGNAKGGEDMVYSNNVNSGQVAVVYPMAINDDHHIASNRIVSQRMSRVESLYDTDNSSTRNEQRPARTMALNQSSHDDDDGEVTVATATAVRHDHLRDSRHL
jgi:hypothetical protein